MFSFIDGYSGYNQVRMTAKDAQKKIKNNNNKNNNNNNIQDPDRKFYYIVMLFGLKNVGAIYRRTMTAIFHDMMHQEMEDYIDDSVIKSKRRERHFKYLE